MQQLLVNDPGYWRSRAKPRDFAEFCKAIKTRGKITGLWEVVSFHPKTHEVHSRSWGRNMITDQGAVNILERAINSSGATLPALFNNLLITNNSGSTTTTSVLTSSNVYTSLAVASTPAAIPSGTQLQIGYGSGTTQTVTTNGSTAQGATSITVNSFTANATYAANTTNVVPIPQVTDNPNTAGLTSSATTPLTAYSGNLSTGAFAYAATTGAGNRNLIETFTFANATNGGSTANGSYTDLWCVNVASSASTNNYINHLIGMPVPCNDSNSIAVTMTIKL